MQNQFSRTERLIGSSGLEKLKNSHILVFGLGGVGSYAVESLMRSGVGKFTLVDNDIVDITNLNRQLQTSLENVGRLKTEVTKERIMSVNPDCVVKINNIFYLPENDGGLFDEKYDYVIDAIDTVSAKIDIAVKCEKNNIPLISSMGTGNKLDPSRLKICDIYETSVCPLCKVMRYELKKRGIKKLRVVFSDEQPIKPVVTAEEERKRKIPPGSVAFVPSAAGLLTASFIVREIACK